MTDDAAAEEVAFGRVAPVIPVRNLEQALRRYEMLGFAVHAYEGPERYGYADRGGVALHLTEAPDHDSTRDGAVVYLFVSDADRLHRTWSSSGVEGRFTKPHDTPYGLREFAFVDTDGTAHRIGSRLAPGAPADDDVLPHGRHAPAADYGDDRNTR